MLELLTGAGLAMAAGLNAYIPLLALGLAGRFLDAVSLPPAWAWLENDWVLLTLAVLLVVEFVADKVPAVDTINDVLQTVVRPTAGGIAFTTGTGSETTTVTEPAELFSTNWVPLVMGILLALGVHLVKTAARPVLNVATAGVAAPVASVTEDIASIALSVLAVVVPILLIVLIPGLAIGAWATMRAVRRRRQRVPVAPGVTGAPLA